MLSQPRMVVNIRYWPILYRGPSHWSEGRSTVVLPLKPRLVRPVHVGVLQVWDTQGGCGIVLGHL